MTKNKLRSYVDALPLIILIIYAILLIADVIQNDSFLLPRHIAGLVVLAINIGMFFWRHQAAVLALGLTLFLGLFGALSLDYSITIRTFYIGVGDSGIPIFYGQPIFFLWLILHFILSGRYYIGIGTKKYWTDFFATLKQNISN